jgi:hypothetical protein
LFVAKDTGDECPVWGCRRKADVQYRNYRSANLSLHRARTGGWGLDTRHDGLNYEIHAGDEFGAVRPDEHDLANISRLQTNPQVAIHRICCAYELRQWSVSISYALRDIFRSVSGSQVVSTVRMEQICDDDRLSCLIDRRTPPSDTRLAGTPEKLARLGARAVANRFQHNPET